MQGREKEKQTEKHSGWMGGGQRVRPARLVGCKLFGSGLYFLWFSVTCAYHNATTMMSLHTALRKRRSLHTAEALIQELLTLQKHSSTQYKVLS